MMIQNGFGVFEERYTGSAREKEIKSKFFHTYGLNPDNSMNVKAYAEYKNWYVNNRKWERNFK